MKHHKYILLIWTLAIILSIFLLGKFQHLESGADQITLPQYSRESYKCFQELINATEIRDSNRIPNYVGINSSDTFNFHRNCIKDLLLNRFKRDTKKMENRKIFKFELEDAREPDEATKNIIRMHRKIELEKSENLRKQANISTAKRSKRHAQVNKPRLIKFETSDAKEPDNVTKELIRRSRARELHSLKIQGVLSNTSAPQMTKKKSSQRNTRSRRSVHIQYPHLVTFQLKDARSSHIDLRENVANQIRDSNANNVLQNESNENQDTQDSFRKENGYLYSNQVIPKISKQIVYLDPTKVRQINNVMLNGDCNANNNYCERYHSHTRKVYNNVGLLAESAKHSSPVDPWRASFRASSPVPIKFVPLNIYQFLQQEPNPAHGTQPIVEIVTQKLYNPYTSPETGFNQEYKSYTKIGKDIDKMALGNKVHQPESILATLNHQPPNSKVEPSHPISDSNDLSSTYRLRKWIPLQHYGKSIHHFADIERPQTILNDNRDLLTKNSDYRENHHQPINAMQEFQELSTLIGKSPSNQIEGLAYLLSKEIQQRSRIKIQDPKQNTSPILFHPEKKSRAIEGNALAFNEIKQLIPSSLTSGLSPNYVKIVNVLESPVINPNSENSHKKQHASEYFFGYQVLDKHSRNNFGHSQRKDSDGVTRGQYHTLLPDGRMQNTIYRADDTGFHADVSFENPKS